MRKAGISPCIDMVLNHTANEHAWAAKARAGDPYYQASTASSTTDTLPRQYEQTLLEVFPNQAPGNFTWYPEMGKWVWTTFNELPVGPELGQPRGVPGHPRRSILDLANRGAEVLRLDAVAFMWKRMGTICQNLPEVHDILQAINQAASVAAPAAIFKAEAIVGPDRARALSRDRAAHAARSATSPTTTR